MKTATSKYLWCTIFLISYVTIISAGSREGRIYNGRRLLSIISHYTSILMSNTLSIDKYVGSGTLISPTHILTVATNIYGFNEWEAGFGSVYFFDLVYYRAIGAVIHEDYNPNNTPHNIGVLIFAAGVLPLADGYIYPAVLPPLGEFHPKSNNLAGSFSGFGYTRHNSNFSEYLLNSPQVTQEESYCEYIFPYDNVTGLFCTRDIMAGPSAPCGGESGAGLTVNGNMVIGLVSGILAHGPCDTAIAVPFHVRISHYREWLYLNFGI